MQYLLPATRHFIINKSRKNICIINLIPLKSIFRKNFLITQNPPWITQSFTQSKELLTCWCQPSGLPLLVVLCGFIKWSYLAEWPNLKLTLSILMFLPQLQSIICHRLLDTFLGNRLFEMDMQDLNILLTWFFTKEEWNGWAHISARCTIFVKRHNFANTRDLFAFVPFFFRVITSSTTEFHALI